MRLCQCFFTMCFTLTTARGRGSVGDIASVGTACYCAVVLAVNLRVAVRTVHWPAVVHFFLWGWSLGGLIVFIFIISQLWNLLMM
jgi:hypothetical protein